MNHLRIVSPSERAPDVLRVLEGSPSVVNVIHLPNAARSPKGDVILCDVAREDTSVVLGDLRRLGLEHGGSIALEEVDIELS
ncbi:MAG: DUF389 domain-containing protein, partial [Gaiellales bacterium]